MKPLRIFLLLIFVFSLNAAFAQRSVSKGKLFIIGGGEKPVEMMNRMVDESGLREGGYAVILPMSSEAQDTSIYYARESFTAAGINNVHGIRCNKEDANSPAKSDSVKFAKLVYISGGDQTRFMEIVSGSDLEKAIHYAYEHGAMVAGTSAGAAVMSDIMITGNQLKTPEYSATFKTIEQGNIETKKGLGLLNHAIVDQHFLIRSRHNRLLTAILEFPSMMGIGIDESTAILVNGKYAEVVGNSQVLVYTNPKKQAKKMNGKFGAKDLRLSIYLAGEKFKI